MRSWISFNSEHFSPKAPAPYDYFFDGFPRIKSGKDFTVFLKARSLQSSPLYSPNFSHSDSSVIRKLGRNPVLQDGFTGSVLKCDA